METLKSKVYRNSDIPVIQVSHLTPEELEAYKIAENQSVMFDTDWNLPLLKLEFQNFEDIKLDLHKNSLTITASKSMEKNEKMKHKYHKTEFRYGDYCRTLYFPNDINVDKCDATLKSGILTIDLEKVQREEEKHKQIEIKE